MITKKQTQTLVVVAISASAIAFLSFKAYKKYKELNEGIISGEQLETELEVAHLLKQQDERTKALDEDFAREYCQDDIAMTEATLVAFTEQTEDEEFLFATEEEEMQILFDDTDEMEEEIIEDTEEGVVELRFPPNSEEALLQYKEMSLAEFDAMGPAKRALYMLFKVPFHPNNEQDSIVVNHIKETRLDFFSEESVYVNEQVSIAELILYFAKMADYDLDKGIEYWSNQLLFNLDIMPGINQRTLENIIGALVSHTYIGEMGYGMFGLDDEEYKQVLNFNQLGGITFLKQYNVFLETELNNA